jgi:hypothetical protein
MHSAAGVHPSQQGSVHPVGFIAILLVGIVAKADQTERHRGHQLEIG